MPHRWICWLLAMLAVAPALAGADDDYIAIYQLIQSGDASRDTGRVAEARAAYLGAQRLLTQLKAGYPNWNERVVSYRMRYVADKLAGLPEESLPTPAPAVATNGVPTLAPSGEVIEQFNDLNQKIGNLRRENATLEARLREALSAQPAPVDPKEFQKAVETIATLQSTNKVLLAQMEQQQAERSKLVDRVVAEEAQAALNDANRRLQAQKESSTKLAAEKADLETALRRLREGDLRKLQSENSTLKEQVTQLKTDTERGRQVADLAAKLGQLQTRLDEAERQKAQWTEERSRLEKQLDDLRARQSEESVLKVHKLETELAVAKADANRQTSRAEELETQIAVERTALGEANKQNKALAERVMALGDEVAAGKAAAAALREEKAARGEAETRLRVMETRLEAANAALAAASATGQTNQAAASAAGLRAQIAELDAEAGQLRENLKESRQREADLAALLTEASKRQTAWAAEKKELLRKIQEAESSGATADPGSQSKLRTLEQRVKQLETERNGLVARLSEAKAAAARQARVFRGIRSLTPRERAMEFRQSH